MRKWWIAIIALCCLLVPLKSQAQGDEALTALEVKFWPEYDAPEMLVIYTFELPANTTLPKEVSFRIPASAGQAFGYGYYPESGGMPLQENYRQRIESGWLRVSFTMRSRTGTLEYYDPALSKSGKQRHFEYIWPGDYAVDLLTLIVQQPPSARLLTTSPLTNRTFSDQNNFTNHLIEAGRLPIGKIYTLTLEYQKDNLGLSVADMPVEAASPLPENAPLTWPLWLSAGLATLGIVLFSSGLLWYIFKQRQPVSQSAPRRRKRPIARMTEKISPTAKTPEKSIPGSEATYCHQCGRRAAAGDRFCRACGTPLQVD